MAQDICVIPELAEAQRLVQAHNVVPVRHSFVSDLDTPVSAFLKLGAPSRSFLLESAEQGRLGRYSFLGVGAHAVVRYDRGILTIEDDAGRREIEHGDPFAAPLELLQAYRPPASGDLPPLAGGLVGYFAYDLVRHLERLPDPPPDDLGLPEMAFLVADTVLVFDHFKNIITVVANAFAEDGGIDEPYRRAVQRIVEVKKKLARPLPAPPAAAAPVVGAVPVSARTARHVTCSMTRGEYERGVERIRDYIAAGDAFQVVLSRRFGTPLTTSPFSVYRALRSVNPSPYMFYIAFGDLTLVGSSPEPLVRVQGDQAEVRPIAGTRRRGVDDAADRRLMAELAADEKERAEHIMLVDLGRNDLGRVCAPGTVRVEELMGVELYSHVMHLVSSVRGTVAPGRVAVDVLKATFPAGTVSGAPKVRAMEIIDELETVRRGPYAGAIGYLSYGGNLDTCICIRTLVIKDGMAYVQTGAGIVADSRPSLEFEETENKAAALLRAVELAHEQFGS